MKAGKIIKYCFVAFAVFVLAVLGFRIFMNSDRSALSDVYPTESAKEAYAKYGEDAFVSFNLPDEMSHDGYITAYSPAYCEKTGEYQITVRYNDSLPENYLKGSDPDKYYFELRDDEGETVARAKRVAEKERYFYNYIRLSFEGITLSEETTLSLYLCSDECQYPAEHTDGIIAAHPALMKGPVKLSPEEKKALEK